MSLWGSKADIPALQSHVRFTPESGHPVVDQQGQRAGHPGAVCGAIHFVAAKGGQPYCDGKPSRPCCPGLKRLLVVVLDQSRTGNAERACEPRCFLD